MESNSPMNSTRTLPQNPDLDQLKTQARELLEAFRTGDAEAIAAFATHPRAVDPQARSN